LNQQILTLFGAQSRMTAAEFDHIFLDLYPRIAAVAFRLLGNADDADEVAAEAFWKLWKTPPASQENIQGWLYRVTTNLSYNLLRSSRRRTTHEERSGRKDLAGETIDHPEALVEINQERAKVRNTLKEMPFRDVQILILRSSGLSYKDIAEVVRVNPGSVGTLIARAEKKFEQLYSRGEKNAPKR
jgi:RNA polymerase sigma-70 factor (ECF subfamily)